MNKIVFLILLLFCGSYSNQVSPITADIMVKYYAYLQKKDSVPNIDSHVKEFIQKVDSNKIMSNEDAYTYIGLAE